jgi:hypothetical protein
MGIILAIFPYGDVPYLHKYNNATDFLSDRKYSFQAGTNPLYFPSGSLVSLYSRSHIMYHPEVLNSFCGKFVVPCEEQIYKSEKKQGQSVLVPSGTMYDPL